MITETVKLKVRLLQSSSKILKLGIPEKNTIIFHWFYNRKHFLITFALEKHAVFQQHSPVFRVHSRVT